MHGNQCKLQIALVSRVTTGVGLWSEVTHGNPGKLNCWGTPLRRLPIGDMVERFLTLTLINLWEAIFKLAVKEPIPARPTIFSSKLKRFIKKVLNTTKKSGVHVSVLWSATPFFHFLPTWRLALLIYCIIIRCADFNTRAHLMNKTNKASIKVYYVFNRGVHIP